MHPQGWLSEQFHSLGNIHLQKCTAFIFVYFLKSLKDIIFDINFLCNIPGSPDGMDNNLGDLKAGKHALDLATSKPNQINDCPVIVFVREVCHSNWL